MSELKRKLARMRQSRERMDALWEAHRKRQEATNGELALIAQGLMAWHALEQQGAETLSVDEFRKVLAARTCDKPK